MPPRLIDITRALYPGHPVWPGDAPFALELTASMRDGQPANVMRFSSTTHLGTHLDAPFHYDPAGIRLGEVPLEVLMGPALVIHAPGRERLGPEVLEGLEALPERVLFFTGQPNRWMRFPTAFTGLSPALVHALARRGVRLVGTDAPSVDRFEDAALPVHRACAEAGVFILEGLVLKGVPAGRYELVCLPLPLPTADAAPVRAILR
ncbi:cyclase family protein [Marinithermus hydrothermalis]|uniref:Kynurenine formamidase n=1 Tax=Marinithermus hydrothermalis (strain DSM 14884 / JCM 11576 / T1) TaxID=869210 RepID=F2NPG7_MARHT|nr:cyclase family protein [Marinithermus hydrothermalis]AEB12248.1 Arylformamidase [Marinithermus hydrothermalis DSM 14884]